MNDSRTVEVQEVVTELEQIAAVRRSLKVGWIGEAQCQGEESECWSCKAVLLDRGLGEFEDQLRSLYADDLAKLPLTTPTI